MAPRTPPRPASKRESGLRYDVVWTLPYSEYTRIGYTESITWWLDTIHTNEVSGRKRFKAIAEMVTACNGSIVLFEVMSNPTSSTFNLRAIERAGRGYQPPSFRDINPVTVEVDRAFKQQHAAWVAKNRKTHSDQPLLRTTKRKRNHGIGYAVSALLGLVALATIAYAVYSPSQTASSSAGNVFTARGRQTDATTGSERPEERIIMPLRDPASRAANLCEFYKMSGSVTQYQGKGPCPPS